MSEKVTKRADGSALLMCESGNPALAVLATPTEQGLIVSLPTGTGIFDTVTVLLGREALDALIHVAGDAWERLTEGRFPERAWWERMTDQGDGRDE